MADRSTGFYWVLAKKKHPGHMPEWQVAGFFKMRDDDDAEHGIWMTVGDDREWEDDDFEAVAERVERTRHWRGTFRRLDTEQSFTVEVDAPTRELARPLLLDGWRHGARIADVPPPWQLDLQVVEHGT